MKKFPLVTAAWLAWVAGSLDAAEAVDTAVLRRKLESTERARDTTRDLVAAILDLQIQQLQENGLAHLPLYRDLNHMRTNIEGLIEAEMAEVVELLRERTDRSPAEQDEAAATARHDIRQVVARLATEHQNLLRRLKAADLAARIRRLLEAEALVLEVTRRLDEQPAARRQAASRAALEEQRQVQESFARLVDMLVEVRGWRGQMGQGAAESLALLEAARVGPALDHARRNLEAADLGRAAEDQEAVVQGLHLLLEKVEQTQTLIQTDREAALAMVGDLILRQQNLRERTQATELTEATADPLVEQQAALQSELAKLAGLLRGTPATLPLLAKAQVAADAATGGLFALEPGDAISEQAGVLDNLAGIEEEISRATQVVHARQETGTARGSAGGAQTALGTERPSRQPSEDRRAGGPGPPRAGLHQADYRREPWFVRLPPEMRRAIESGARRPAPPGYAERLRRYFEKMESEG